MSGRASWPPGRGMGRTHRSRSDHGVSRSSRSGSRQRRRRTAIRNEPQLADNGRSPGVDLPVHRRSHRALPAGVRDPARQQDTDTPGELLLPRSGGRNAVGRARAARGERSSSVRCGSNREATTCPPRAPSQGRSWSLRSMASERADPVAATICAQPSGSLRGSLQGRGPYSNEAQQRQQPLPAKATRDDVTDT